MKRVGILTGGGDCPGLNAVLRACGKTLINRGWEVVGFEDGFLGVLERRHRPLDTAALSGILSLGGTILGTSNRDNPFKWYPAGTTTGIEPRDRSGEVRQLCADLGLAGLVVIGGDGTLSIARRLTEEAGVPCVGVPKTIDNDLSATDVTFGFDTALQVATEAIDRLHSTAMSHHRAMVVELMGRYAGWLGLFAGVAGGADVVLIPEIPYSEAAVEETIRRRSRHGSRFSIVVASEGAKTLDGEMVVDRMVEGSHDPIRLGGIGARLAKRIETATGVEARATVLGHLQRGGSPTNRDRLLATQFGHVAAELVDGAQWGLMAAVQGGAFRGVPLAEAVGTLKLVRPDDPLVKAAREIGVSFGDTVPAAG